MLSSSHWAQQTLLMCVPTVCQASARPCLEGPLPGGGADTKWTSQSTGLWSLGKGTPWDERAGFLGGGKRVGGKRLGSAVNSK